LIVDNKEILTSSLNKLIYSLFTSINTWVLCSVLTLNGHEYDDILTTHYLRHPSKYVFYEN